MEKQKPTVLVVGPWVGTGGVITFQRNLILHSKLDRVWDFRQYNLSRIPHTVSKSVIYERQTFSFLRSGKRHFLKNAAIVARNFSLFSVELRRVDLVQIQSSDYYAFWEAAIYLLLAKAQNKPVSMRFGGTFNVFYNEASPKTQALIRYLLTLPDAIIVQSEMWRQFFATIAPPEKLNIMPNAVPAPPPMPTRSPKTTGIRALFICTNEAKRKGVDTVLKVVPTLKDRVEFVFVAVPESLKEEIVQLGLDAHIEMHGHIPRDQLKETFYPEADVLLLPSHYEGFPNSMLEAMAAGLPLITSPAGAIPEVITQGVHGFINDASDSDALQRDLRTLCDQPKKRLEMGAACYELIKEKYVIDTAFDRFNGIWNSILPAKGS